MVNRTIKTICAITLLYLFNISSLGAQTEENELFMTPDTIIAPADTIAIFTETIVAPADTIAISADTIAAPIEPATTPTKKPPVVASDNAANPHKATLWALFPGGGQVYNWNHGDKWWIASLKLTAIYGGFGTLAYFTVRNTNDYRDFREAYKWVSSKQESGKENKYTDGSYSEDQLKSYMNYYQTNMEWCYFFIGLLYGLQIVEATVTAHLLTFDISDDLSFSVKPLPLPLPDRSFSTFNSAIGLSLRYKVQYK